MLNKLKALLVGLQVLLDGKKTYLTGIASICTGLATSDWNLVFVGLSAIFLRNGIAKG